MKAARRALTSANPAPALDGYTVSVDRNGVIQSFADMTTADTALRLAQLFKTTPQFWMHMQANCDLKAAMARRRATRLAGPVVGSRLIVHWSEPRRLPQVDCTGARRSSNGEGAMRKGTV